MAPPASHLVSLKCSYRTPKSTDSAQDAVSRWSHNNIALPGLFVTPNNEDDIVDAIHYAKVNGLKVVPVGGGQGTFVTTDASTLYLEMKNMKSVALDKSAGTATVGGGALVGDVRDKLCAEGYCTVWANSNTVGMVGSVLGGGLNRLNGTHGLIIDNVLSFRIITADGQARDVSASSEGEELALFNALLGAGHGLGVCTSMTIKAFPLADLGSPNGDVQTRRLVFPTTALDTAIDTLLELHPPHERQRVFFTFARAPPGSPAPGTPMVIVSAEFIGPVEEADKAAQPLLDPEAVAKAMSSDASSQPYATANDAATAMDTQGGFKSVGSAFLTSMSAEALRQCYSVWSEFTDGNEDAVQTGLQVASWNTRKIEEIGKTTEGQAGFFGSRERGIYVIVMSRALKPDGVPAVEAYIEKALKAIRHGSEEEPKAFANLMRAGGENIDEIYSKERVAELKRVKKRWDPEGLIWSPHSQ